MIEFMFGVLGSVVFWILFFMVGFFAGTLVLKRIAPKTYLFVTTGKFTWFRSQTKPTGSDWIVLLFLLLFIYVCWPIVVAILAIGLIVKYALWKPFCSGVKAVDSIIPDIQFKKKDDTE